MSENRGIMLAKSMQKHAGRAKEKILQNLGKVDRTADEIFDDHLNNFNRQQTSANRLQKEFNNYIRCIRAAQIASKSLMDAVCEIYEPQWSGYDALLAQTAASESLWQDFAHKLADQVLIPLNTYTGQFPEMKKKVEKRNRKLIDYDSQRHSFQSLQASTNKRKDEIKLTKGRDQLEEARRTYEILNTELHDELPALYDSRILFLVTNLQTLFATEQVFHSETAKIYSELEAIVDKLATESQRGSNTLRKQALNAIKTSSPVQSPVKQLNNANLNNNSNNYQNQITTNGGASLANSPNSANCSELEPRFDTVSSTPELTPEKPKLLATPAMCSSGMEMADKQLNEAATAATKTVEQSATSSPNAHTVRANKTEAIATESNGITAAAAAAAAAAATTTTTTAAETTTLATKTNGEQLNGNNDIKMSNEQQQKLDKEAIATNNGNNNKQQQQQQLQREEEAEQQVQKASLGKETGNEKERQTIIENTNTSSKLVNNRKKIKNKNPFEDDNEDEDERIYEVPKDANTADLPPGTLYRVKATYGYVKEDVDELSFEIGDIIRVIEYDDPEDQEEGWLMGQKEGTNEKGLFPANFTRPI